MFIRLFPRLRLLSQMMIGNHLGVQDGFSRSLAPHIPQPANIWQKA